MVRDDPARPSSARASGNAAAQSSSWRGDLAGGVSGAVSSLALALSLGILAFAPLGPAHAEVGVLAGFAAAIYGQLVAAWLGGTTHPGSGPRASTSLVVAGLVAALAADPTLAPDVHGPGRIVAVAGFTVLLSGVFQTLLGFARAGALARYVPYPFIAGVMCGASVLIIVAQVPALTGIPAAELKTAPAVALAKLQPATLFVGLATILLVYRAGRFLRRVPGSLAGLIGGTALYFAISALLPGVAIGPTIGAIPPGLPLPTALSPVGRLLADVQGHLTLVVSTAAIVALIGSLDSLFSMVAVDHAVDGRHRADRELVAHGVANIVSGLCGGVPVDYSRARAMASWEAGGRHPRTATIAAGVLALIVVAGGRLLAIAPLAVLGGVMVTLGIGLIDRWASGLVARLRSHGTGDRTLWLAVLTVAGVALAAIALGFLPAILVGFLLSGALFIAGMNRSLVRSVVDATVRPSRRVWGGQDAQRLVEVRRRIRVVELEGALFFGSAERLSEIVEPLAGAADTVILDFRHVSAIDATGTLVVERLARRLGRRGTALLLANVTPEGRHGRAFLAHNAFVDPATRGWFPDTDQAVEWAEQRGLEASGRSRLAEIPLEQSDLAAGLAPEALATVESLLERHVVEAGHTLFREGDAGSALFLIAHGAVEISIALPGGRRTRIVTMAEGAIFGEAALLDGRPRSATALAIEPTVVYALSRDALFTRLARDAPDTAIKLLLNLARVLATRMRETNEIVRRLEESRG